MTGPAHDYIATLDALEASELGHDEIERAAFDAADLNLCEAIEAAMRHGGVAGEVAADDVRELRRRLYQLHSAWRCRRAGVVADSPEMMAGAIATIEERARG